MNTNKFHNEVLVQKSCTRTSGADTIDGNAVTGVQIWTSEADLGAVATTYYGPGETVVTDTSGKPMASGDLTKLIPAISLHHRSLNGKNKFAGMEIAGKMINSYEFTAHTAPSEFTVAISNIDASLADYLYTLTFEVKENSQRTSVPTALRRSASFRTGLMGNTQAEIAAGLVADINLQFNPKIDTAFRIKAFVDSTTNNIVIQALPNEWDGIRFLYYKTLFLTTLNFDADVTSNEAADMTWDTIVYPQATEGAGNYEQVFEAEFSNKRHYGMNEGFYENVMLQSPSAMDATEFEIAVPTVKNTYDTVIINLHYIDSGSTGGTLQARSIELYMPIEANGVGSQQLDIMTLLNKYIVTEWGVGSAITLT